MFSRFSETADLSFGLFGTLSVTVKNLGIENFTDASANPKFDSTGLYKGVKVVETGNYSVANVGDVNGDGTVDVTDYQSLVNMAVSDGHAQSGTVNYDDIAKYDLDGDGYVDALDASLMALVVNGQKTIDVYAVGDYDLSGVAFEEADLKAIKHAIEKPEKLATYKKYACDINNDGKVSAEDLTELENAYGVITGATCADNVKVTYNWSSDYSTCTATAKCAFCKKIVASETVNSIIDDNKYYTSYTADFENELFESQIIEFYREGETTIPESTAEPDWSDMGVFL